MPTLVRIQPRPIELRSAGARENRGLFFAADPSPRPISVPAGAIIARLGVARFRSGPQLADVHGESIGAVGLPNSRRGNIMALWAILISNFITIIMAIFGFASEVTTTTVGGGGTTTGIL